MLSSQDLNSFKLISKELKYRNNMYNIRCQIITKSELLNKSIPISKNKSIKIKIKLKTILEQDICIKEPFFKNML